jgi:hypothetical protein
VVDLMPMTTTAISRESSDEPERFSEAPIVEIGQWYWVKGCDKGSRFDILGTGEWFGCVVQVGSNFIELQSIRHGNSTYHDRVHLAQLMTTCRRELDPQGVIRDRIAYHQQHTRALLTQIRDLTAALGVAPSTAIGVEQQGETRALATIQSGTDMAAYQQALTHAKTTELPDLFAQVERSNENLASWMSAEVLPMQAQFGLMKGCINGIEERIFHVQLYAGLTEQVERIRDGAPAGREEKVRLLQKRLYMDEECLLDYDAGGMAFRDIHAFDAWLCRPHNLAAILPFPRCLVAFQVRRNVKERHSRNLLSAYINICLEQEDRLTFFYLRNGDQVYRLSTNQELKEALFPDLAEFDFSQPMMASCSRDGKLLSLITCGDFAVRLAAEQERQRLYDAWKREHPRESWINNPHHSGEFHPSSYAPFDATNVYYDDIKRKIDQDMTYYNRIVLILQGLFDRSPVFAPHLPAKLWSSEGFNQVVELVYDRDRALYAGEKPDFAAFRDQCNASLKPGCVVIGMQAVWERQREEADEKKVGIGHDRHGEKRHRWDPHADRGPGFLARVSRVHGNTVTVEYLKPRQKSVMPNRWSTKPVEWKAAGDPMTTTVTALRTEIFNASAYTPGDYRLFLADPRTRADYLQWAPFLLGAEDFCAGKRQVEYDRTKR